MNIQTYHIVWLDHAFVFLFAVAFPMSGYFNYRKTASKIASGVLTRSRAYVGTMTSQWLLAILGLAIWRLGARDWGTLGFDLELSPALALAVGVIAVFVAYLTAILVAVRNQNGTVTGKFEAEIESIVEFVPLSRRDLRSWYGLSATAGIVEEVLWRGYLIWYLVSFVPIWAAVLASGIMFGFGHAYQGAANLPKLCAVGVLLATLYILAGSVWPLIALHILGDMIQGRTGFDFLRLRRARVCG